MCSSAEEVARIRFRKRFAEGGEIVRVRIGAV